MIGASAALSISEIPWAGPIGAVNIGYVDGEYIVNPTVEQREVSLMNLTVAGTAEAVLMVEAGAKEISEADMLRAKKMRSIRLEISANACPASPVARFRMDLRVLMPFSSSAAQSSAPQSRR